MDWKDVKELADTIGLASLILLIAKWLIVRARSKEASEASLRQTILATAEKLLGDTIADLKAQVARLTAEVESLEEDNHQKDIQIIELRARIRELEQLVK